MVWHKLRYAWKLLYYVKYSNNLKPSSDYTGHFHARTRWGSQNIGLLSTLTLYQRKTEDNSYWRYLCILKIRQRPHLLFFVNREKLVSLVGNHWKNMGQNSWKLFIYRCWFRRKQSESSDRGANFQIQTSWVWIWAKRTLGNIIWASSKRLSDGGYYQWVQ